MADGPLLALEDLRVEFGRRNRSMLGRRAAVHAVDGVDLTVAPGECLAIVGESGSGKSTLARSIVGLVRPTGGCIRFEGEDVTGARGARRRSLRRRVQMVFQDPYSSVNPRFSVRDVIAEPLEGYRVGDAPSRRARVLDLLARVNLSADMVDRPVTSLSGGQLQRVGIARAIALDPRLLIADEPVSALDVSVQAQILELLTGLRTQDGIASVFITHNLAVAEHVADRIAVMRSGQIVEVGDARRVVGAPEHPYTRALLDAVPTLERPDPAPSVA